MSNMTRFRQESEDLLDDIDGADDARDMTCVASSMRLGLEIPAEEYAARTTEGMAAHETMPIARPAEMSARTEETPLAEATPARIKTWVLAAAGTALLGGGLILCGSSNEVDSFHSGETAPSAIDPLRLAPVISFREAFSATHQAPAQCEVLPAGLTEESFLVKTRHQYDTVYRRTTVVRDDNGAEVRDADGVLQFTDDPLRVPFGGQLTHESRIFRYTDHGHEMSATVFCWTIPTER